MLLHQYQYHHHDLWNWNMFSVIRQNVSTLAVFICVHPSAACPIHPFLPIAFAFSRGSTTSQEFLFSRVTFNRKELASPWKWKSSCCHPHCLRTLLSAESNGPHAVLEKSHRNISDMLLLWEPGYIFLFILTTSSLCSVHPWLGWLAYLCCLWVVEHSSELCCSARFILSSMPSHLCWYRTPV